ncbi:hypothetical protein [uncultured Olegusella sp.]|uniref:hypothetical protein n=1 Tax=uncultured Olegusella sp. TaxID=1979846 RepID=UPI002639E529|nr:hypothetical protein [uncultured Olegusella sp.]
METVKAVRHIVDGTGVSHAEVSRRMSRGIKFVDSILTRERVPRVDTLALIAHACGWRLVLEREDGSERIELEPKQDDKGKRQ